MRVGLPSWRPRGAIALAAWAGRIGAAATDTDETALQKRLAVVLCAGTIPLTVLWSVIYLLVHAPLAAAIPGFYSIFTLVNTAFFARTGNLEFYRFTQLFLILILPWLLTIELGGFRQSSVVIIWAALCPLGSLLLDELRRTVLWVVGLVALLVVTALLQPHLAPAHLPDAFVTWFFVLNVGTVIAIAFGLLYYFVGRRNFFQERSEMLLLNILPKEISEALKAEPRTIAAHYDDSQHPVRRHGRVHADGGDDDAAQPGRSPQRRVPVLRRARRQVRPGEDQDDRRLLHGRRRRAATARRSCPGPGRLGARHAEPIAGAHFGGRQLAFRIGINSGPVVAGVIGHKKFIYDLWGETVNMASRMESHGQSGVIQITRNTYDLISDEFDCEAQGTIEVKGAGRVETWCVTNRKQAGEPPRIRCQ